MLYAKAILSAVLAANPAYKNIDTEEAYCLAENIYHETRGETASGQVAVATATLERLSDERYPRTICGVVKQAKINPRTKKPYKNKCAFSWYCDGKNNKISFYTKDGKLIEHRVQMFVMASTVAAMTISNQLHPVCKGSNYYYNPDKANPAWASMYTAKCTIGNHVFLRREEGSLN